MNPASFSIRTEPSDPLALSGDVVGRPVAANSDPAYCSDWITKWLSRCEKEHPRCQRPIITSRTTNIEPHKSEYSDDAPLPPRLIEVGSSTSKTLSLRETRGMRGRYCALSYSWGRSKSFKTSKATYQERLRGFALDDLPTTIRDAIRLTRALQFQFIWVDALCIVQDDKLDWAENSAIMDQIYGFATITIAASLCDDKWHSLYRKRNQPQSIRISSLSNTKSRIKPERGVMTISRRDGVFSDIFMAAPLASRAWTLQEWLLSRRTVHITSEQIFWECQERGFGEDGSSFDQSFSSRVFLPPAGISPKPDLTQMLSRWKGVVDAYSQRKLFATSDKLPALAGLAHQFQQLTDASYLAGMWREEMPLGLLWTVQTSSLVETGRSAPEWRAPSWSWASIDGAVHCDGYQGLVLMASPGPTLEQLEIVASEITLKNEANPFGEVTKAVLRVRGKAQRLRRKPQRLQHRTTSGRSGSVPLGYSMQSGKGGVTFDNEATERGDVPEEFSCLLVDKRVDDEGELMSAFLVIEEVPGALFDLKQWSSSIQFEVIAMCWLGEITVHIGNTFCKAINNLKAGPTTMDDEGAFFTAIRYERLAFVLGTPIE
ncbi:hypothetical protein H2200_001967 [Cladophialophora chaetospira]|uniref:Heterokaryon incompatibility domain-containing protein n=1 Tax=Cladophialophora chaetospira TaxID=386627 RepID=A0AA38XMR5_9EURO|nr:hypothetical protein H2200_001967 [Cladophialophora chaetospira]